MELPWHHCLLCAGPVLPTRCISQALPELCGHFAAWFFWYLVLISLITSSVTAFTHWRTRPGQNCCGCLYVPHRLSMNTHWLLDPNLLPGIAENRIFF